MKEFTTQTGRGYFTNENGDVIGRFDRLSPGKHPAGDNVYESHDVPSGEPLPEISPFAEHTLDEAKDKKIREIKEEAQRRLSHTDWYVIRESDIGKPVPAEIKEYRSDIRNVSDTAEEKVNSAESRDEISNISISWPTEP